MTVARAAGLAVLAAALAACAPAQRAPPAAAREVAGPSSLDYRFELDRDLSRLQARLCMRGPAPATLVYGSRTCAPFLRSARVAGGRALPLRDGQIVLAGVPADGCVEYEVDLAAAIERDALLVAYAVNGAAVTSTELFLWRPSVRPAGMSARARFVVPEGIDVSVPWRRAGPAHDYVLEHSAFAFTGRAAFGRLSRLRASAAGAALDITLLPGVPDRQRELVAAWLERSVLAVARMTGPFPVRALQLIVAPTSPSSRPIHFGHVGRSGGGSILFFLPTDLGAEELAADFIAVHELSHLVCPLVRRQDAWLSEGLATYLQEVLRARAGLQPKEAAWRRIYEGSLLGRQAEGSLAAETLVMPTSGNYARVYWAGAAIALAIDVELRVRTAGRHSLPSVLARLSRASGSQARAFTAGEVLRALDELSGTQVATRVAQAALQREAFPSVDEFYRNLGVSADGESLPGAEWSAIRDAIMR